MQLDIKSTQNRKIINFKKYGFKDLQLLGKYNYNKVENKLQSHVHKEMIEICYYDKGSQFFEVNEKTYLVKGGDVFIHYPGEMHGSGGHPEEKGALYWIIISIEKLLSNNLVHLCRLLMQKQKRHFKAGKEIKKILEEIYKAHARKESSPVKKIRIHLMAQSLILALLDNIDNEKHDTDNVRLNKILHYINKNLTDNISIALLAKEINLSESRFKNLFKELTGFTPGDYIQRKKVEIAVERIANDPGLSLTDLAYEMNFSSPQYFSSVVKKYTGKSPRHLKT